MWQLAAAAITGFIAKENVVGTLAVVYGLTAFIDVDELALTGGANNVAMAMGLTSVTALAYLFFNLYTPPCFAAIGAMNSEMKSKGWLWGAIGLQLGTGYRSGVHPRPHRGALHGCDRDPDRQKDPRALRRAVSPASGGESVRP